MRAVGQRRSRGAVTSLVEIGVFRRLDRGGAGADETVAMAVVPHYPLQHYK